MGDLKRLDCQFGARRIERRPFPRDRPGVCEAVPSNDFTLEVFHQDGTASTLFRTQIPRKDLIPLTQQRNVRGHTVLQHDVFPFRTTGQLVRELIVPTLFDLKYFCARF